jgi:hypothetical protein
MTPVLSLVFLNGSTHLFVMGIKGWKIMGECTISSMLGTLGITMSDILLKIIFFILLLGQQQCSRAKWASR